MSKLGKRLIKAAKEMVFVAPELSEIQAACEKMFQQYPVIKKITVETKYGSKIHLYNPDQFEI